MITDDKTREVLNLLRECNAATAQAVKKETQTAFKREQKAYAAILKMLLGRNPTAEEVSHASGGDELL